MVAFTKMHGCGNDFVVFDGFANDLQLTPAQVEYLCDRHMGVGADGVIIVRPSEVSDGFMDYINADGSLAQMCGNGVRVAAKFLVDNGYVEPTGSLSLDTRSGVREISYETNKGLLTTATVDMGEPVFDTQQIPLHPDSVTRDAEYPQLHLETPYGRVELVATSMGNPHAVWFIDDLTSLPPDLLSGEARLDNLNIDGIGAYLESHEAFPEKANIEFVVQSDNGLQMRVFERGVGETLACGTGACAVLATAALTGRSERSNTVSLPGGNLYIKWNDNNHIYMTGPATTVYTGSIDEGTL